MTNREYIEQKTDEELADFYSDLVNTCIKLRFYHADYVNDRDKMLEFLRAEYTNEECDGEGI